MRAPWFLITALLFSFACTSSHKAVMEEVKVVMEAHDKAMLLMDPISETQLALNGYLKQTGTTALDSAAREEVLSAVTTLTKADNAMMDWMKGFEMPAENEKKEVAMAYLAEEKKKIETVYTEMQAAIELGKRVKEKYAPKP
jgi:hypothetical protein